MTSDSTRRPPVASPAGSAATLITIAPTGAESEKAAVPALPVTLDELVATPATLVRAVAALPEGVSWSATGIGRSSLPVMFAALAAGGHLRVGMEDTISFARGLPVTDNAELVERAAALAELAQRPAMTTPDAHAMLGVPDRR